MYEPEVLGRYEKQAIFTPSQIGLGMFILDSRAAQATVGFFIVFYCYCQIKKINLNSGNHRKIGCPGVLGSSEALRKLQGGVACVVQCASLGVSCIPEKSFLSHQLSMDYVPFYCINCPAEEQFPCWVS